MRQQLAGIVAAARSTYRDGRTAAEDPVLRQNLAAVVTELECLRYHSFHVLSQVEKGRDLGFEASMTKLQWSETMQDLFEAFDEILGPNVTAPAALRRGCGDHGPGRAAERRPVQPLGHHLGRLGSGAAQRRRRARARPAALTADSLKE